MSDYRDFVNMARERRQKGAALRSDVLFTRHAEFKMKQYGLSAQRVRSVMRNPRRREEGIAKDTVAVMQPSSVKRKDGKETWAQEIWVMYAQRKSVNKKQKTNNSASGDSCYPLSVNCSLRVISAWRYPGVSPKRNPVPEEILREIEEGSILESEGIIL
ncbi:MAG: hypothetical protein HGA38_03835 [Candidatus Moranbacteria bacterium]|nr:hypothetical protein [Candidatus Moranbacteria bacterium]